MEEGEGVDVRCPCHCTLFLSSEKEGKGFTAEDSSQPVSWSTTLILQEERGQ